MLGKIENRPPQEQRSMQEMAVYRLLEQLAIPFSRMDHAPVMTAADGACDGCCAEDSASEKSFP